MRVRFRVDGVLYEAARVPKRMVAGVVSRVKIMSELDIAEKRVPQDGRVRVNVEDRRVDLRVTTLPTQRGEGCTIRILDKSQALQLARRARDGRRGQRALRGRVPQALRRGARHRPDRLGQVDHALRGARTSSTTSSKNIVTIEDPVEYRLSGINQISVNRKAGLDFATGLRSILRADPDMIMVGEIRDAETARIAIEAALTGHMVLTTLHTNDAPGRDHAAGEDGDRVLPDRVGGRLRRRPAPRAQALHRTASAASLIPAKALQRGRLPRRRRRRGLRAGRLRALQPDGYRGRIGPLLGDGDERGDQGHDGRQTPPSRTSPAIAREEGMLTLREDGPRQGPRGHHQHRGGRPGRELSRRRHRAQALAPNRPISNVMDFDFAEVLTRMVEERASDVHLTPGFPPAIRVRGRITPMEDYPPLDRAADPRGRLPHPQRRPAQALREQQAARLRLRDSRTSPASASTASSSAARSAPPSG